MGEVVNLRRARKALERRAASAKAAENRARFGRSAEDRQKDAAERRQERGRLEAHRLDEPGPAGDRTTDDRVFED